MWMVGMVIGWCLGWAGAEARPVPAKKEKGKKTVYDIQVKGIDGKLQSLSEMKGKVLLVVNTASFCGYTSQYTGLEALYQKYKDRGLVVLGFPSNDFGRQEPGSDEEIKTFCTTKYKVTFPMFSKITVKGPEKHPLYRFLTEENPNPKTHGDISWNFNKFLLGRQGEVLERFASGDAPEGSKILQALEKALAVKP